MSQTERNIRKEVQVQLIQISIFIAWIETAELFIANAIWREYEKLCVQYCILLLL